MKKEFLIDVSPCEGRHEGSVGLKTGLESNVCLRSTVTSLKKRELVNILELAYVCYEDNYSADPDSRTLVVEALKLLQSKGKIEQADMEKLLDRPKDIKKLKEELLSEKCKKAEI